MSDTLPADQPQRNPDTYAAYKRDVFRQITLPTLVGLIVILGLSIAVIYAAASGNSQVSRWADISLVWLLLPVIFLSLLFLALLVGITFLITRLLHIFPVYAYKVQIFFNQAQTWIKSGTDIAVEPILKINSFLASARTLLRR